MIGLLRSEVLAGAGFRLHGFSTRAGGVSSAPYDSANFGDETDDLPGNVRKNHELLVRQLGLGGPMVRARQVHGVRVLRAQAQLAPREGALPDQEADGLFSEPGGPAVGIKTADCAAVLIGTTDLGAVATLHAGWRGAAAGIVSVGVESLVAMGARPARMVAAIGPTLCRDCFEVGEEVANRFGDHAVSTSTSGKWLLDIRSCLRGDLEGAGIPETQIEVLPFCTLCRKEMLFSYRGSGGRCGRMLAFVSPRATAAQSPQQT